MSVTRYSRRQAALAGASSLAALAQSSNSLSSLYSAAKGVWDKTREDRIRNQRLRREIDQLEERSEMPRRKVGKKASMRAASSSRHSSGGVLGVSRVSARKRVKKVNSKALTCVSKSKFSGNATSVNTGSLYVTHATHPPKYVLRHVCMSIIELYFRKVGCPIQSWNSSMSQFSGYSTQRLILDMTYQDRNDGQIQARNHVFTTNITYLAMADEFADQLIFLCGPNDGDFKVLQIQLHAFQGSTDGSTPHPFVYFIADALKIGVYGASTLDVQNRTLGGGGTSTDNALSIYNNPLEGRLYSCKGLNAIVQNPEGVETGKIIPFQVDVTTGLYSNRSAGSTMPTLLVDHLTEPPHPRFFKNIYKTGFINIGPGEIKKHTIHKYTVKSLNGWLSTLRNWMQSGVSLDGTQSSEFTAAGAVISRTSNFTGLNTTIAVSKACDLGSATVAIGFERSGYMASRAWYKPNFIIPATNENMQENAEPA